MFHLPILALTFAFPGDAEPAGKLKLAVSFQVPSSAEKATITEVRVVGKALWVRVDVTGGGVGLAVISTVTAAATVEAPPLLIRYFVFGKTWNWKNEEKGIIFLKDQNDRDRAEIEKRYASGKVVFTAKK